MRRIKAKIPRLGALSIFFSFALALFFFWLRVVALATGTSILLDVVLDQETLGLVFVVIGWLYAFFVIGTSVVSLWKHGEATALIHIHANATSRLFWLGVVMLLLVLLFTAASMAAVSASIVVAWSVIYVAVMLLLAWVQLQPSLKLPLRVKQLLRLVDMKPYHPSSGLMTQAELPPVANQLCSAWCIAQIIHDYCAQKGHAPWNGFYRESNPEVVALWVEGLQQALAEFLDVVVIVEQRGERNFASLYGCWDEFVSGAQRVWRPSRNIVTLDFCEWHEREPDEPACAMSLRELFAHGDHSLIDGLLRRFDKNCVAPYTAEALATVVAQGSKKSVWKLCWVYSRSGSGTLTLLAFESVAGLGVEEGVLLPAELCASEVSAVEFADWGLFHRGFVQVSLPAAPHVYGLINKAGEFVLSPQWLDLHWSSAKWVAVKNTQGEWGVVGLSNTTELMLTPKTLVPFESPDYWLGLYEQQVGEGSYRPRVSWGNKTDEEKIVEQMEQVFIAAKQAQVDAAKSAASLASVAGLFDHTTGEKELSSFGLWGMRVEVIAFAGCDQRHEKLVGQQGVIMSHYPVNLSTFDLAIEAPLEGLASYPNAVMGVSWVGLKWINT